MDAEESGAQGIHIQEKTEEKQSKEGQEKNGAEGFMKLAYFIILVLGIAIMALVYLRLTGESKPINPEEHMKIDFSLMKEYFLSINESANEGLRYIEERRLLGKNYDRNITLAISDEINYVDYVDRQKRIVILEKKQENKTVVCLQLYKSSLRCGEIESETSSLYELFSQYTLIRKSYEINISKNAVMLDALEKLGQKGVIRNITTYEENGNKCIEYLQDYSDLSDTDRISLGIDVSLIGTIWKIKQCKNEMNYPILSTWNKYVENTVVEEAQVRIEKIEKEDIRLETVIETEEAESLAYTYLQIEKDIRRCKAISNPNDRKFCLLELPSNYGIAQLCEYAEDLDSLSICLQASFVYNSDPSVCNIINNETLRDECFLTAGLKTDKRACSGITNDSLRQICLEKSKEHVTQCTRDVDCRIYNGEFCLPANLSNTSGYELVESDPAGCYVYADCTCHYETCGWVFTEKYRKCNAEKERNI